MSKILSVEQRSIDFIPDAERHGRAWHLWAIWFTGDAHLATLATGAISVAMGGTLAWSLVAVLFGSALGTLFMAFHSAQGPQLGLPQMIQSRPQFGYRGALLVWLVALVTYIGFNAFNQLLAADTIHQLTGIGRIPALLGFTLLALAVAVAGYRLIHQAQRILSCVMILGLGAFTILALLRLHVPPIQLSLAPAGFRTVPFLTQFFAASAYQLSWSIYVSDYSRYLPRNVGVRSTFWWTFSGGLTGGVWMMGVGTVAASVVPGADIVHAMRVAGDMLHPGFGVLMLGISLLGLVTVTGLNFYGASLTLLSMMDSLLPVRPGVPIRSGIQARLAMLLLAAVAATAIGQSSGNLTERISELLAILLYLFTPWTAINLVDFYLVRKGHYQIEEIFNPDGIYGRWNWRGMLSYFVGFVAMIPFFSTGVYVGAAARALGGADISMLVGLPVAALCYLACCRAAPPETLAF